MAEGSDNPPRIFEIEFYEEGGRRPVLDWIKEDLTPIKRRALGTAMRTWQGQAADVLQREAGIPSQTAAMLLRRIERGEEDAIPRHCVVVVDEASVIPTRAFGTTRPRRRMALGAPGAGR